MRRQAWLATLALLAFAGIASTRASEGALRVEPVLRDAEFGVRARAPGLERRVAMYQWRADGAGYDTGWETRPIDSGGFAAGHDNPDEFPLRSRRWLAERVVFDGRPLDPEVLERLGQWRPMRPDFAALPGNLAVTFQPEGDGLGSAVNPLDPQVGDLRIIWRALVLPPLEGKVELRDGRWQLVAGATAATPAVDETTGDRAWPSWPSWPWWLALFALAIVGGWWLRRRARR